MKEQKVDEAIKYANATNKIEDMNMTKEELNTIKNALLDDKGNNSFLYNIVNKIRNKEEKSNGKNRK